MNILSMAINWIPSINNPDKAKDLSYFEPPKKYKTVTHTLLYLLFRSWGCFFLKGDRCSERILSYRGLAVTFLLAPFFTFSCG